MTLPNEEVMDFLQDRFVLGFRNIEREGHVGLSHGYGPNHTAVGTMNGSGGRNVQIVVLAADRTVLHVLPGFWHADDLLAELRLALDVHRLHGEESIDAATRLAMYGALHRSHLRRHGNAAERRGGWQPFDSSHELARAASEPRDTVVVQADGSKKLKSIPQLVHDRMLARPFRKLADFDMESFVDYGRPFYDNNQGLDRGRDFPRAAQSNAKRERAQELAQREAAETEQQAQQALEQEARKAVPPRPKAF